MVPDSDFKDQWKNGEQMIEPTQKDDSEELPANPPASRAGPMIRARHLITRFLPGMLVLLPNLFLCASPYIGDTLQYTGAITSHFAGQRIGPFQPLWEFGHLLWRPLGALLAPLSFAVVPDSWAQMPGIKLAFGFLAINILAGLGTASLLYDLFHRLAGWKTALLLTFGLSWSSAFLMYTLSGSSYVAGLFFEVAALWLLIPSGDAAKKGSPGAGRWIAAGVSMAVGALFWFPYILVAPAVAAVPWLMGAMRPRDGMRALLYVGLTSAACILIGIAAGAWLADARTPDRAVEWFRDARHQLHQNRQWMRAVSGIPRLMIDLSSDGILLKRFAFHDPFHQVSAWDLARLSLWKLAAFYAFFLSVLVMAARTPRARPALALLTLAGVPVLLFTIVLFEPSGPDKFLPVLPFLLLAAATGWSGRLRWVAGAFLLVGLPGINAPAFVDAFSTQQRSVLAQLKDYSQFAASTDLLVTVTFSDPLPQWLEQRIYHPSMRNRFVPTYQLIEIMMESPGDWQGRFAKRVLRHWNGSGAAPGADVWVRQGALRERPDEILQWVEGDSQSLHWADVTGFLNTFEYDRRTALAEGFARLARSENNRRTLERLTAAGKEKKP